MEVGYYGMPLGFRFHPTDQELVSSYLRDRALSGKPLGNPFVHEFNLFGQTPPWVVWEQFDGNSLLDQDLFFFYELRSRSDSDSRSKRQIEAGGTWSETSSDKVLGLDGIPIGDKGHFRYNNMGSNNNGGWLLEEYSLLPNVVAGPKVVLSRLKRNPRSRCGNKMNSSSPTHDFNEKPPIKWARKEVSKEKPLIKRKRARKEPGSQKHSNVNVITNTPAVVPFVGTESNMITDTRYQDQECITNINGNAKPTDFSDQDSVILMSDVPSYPICLDGDTSNHDLGCISYINGNLMPIPTHISEHEYVPLMSDVPSSPVFLGGEEYPLDGEAVRGDIKEWLTTLEVYLTLPVPSPDKGGGGGGQSRRIYCKEGQCTYLFLFLPSIVYYLQASMKWWRVLKLPHFEEFFKVLIVVLRFVRRLPCCTAGSDREAALIGEFDLLHDPAAAAAASVADEIETGLRTTDE
ncbi:unnamed protein product [Malus baccata var. baccata]